MFCIIILEIDEMCMLLSLPYCLATEYVQPQEASRDRVGLLEQLICIQVPIEDPYSLTLYKRIPDMNIKI